MSESVLMRGALALARDGWKVLPCIESGPKAKAPYLPTGFKAASKSAERVRQWWTKHPKAMVGIAVPSGVVVVDLDPRHIPACERLLPSREQERMTASLHYLMRSTGVILPDTLTAVSGRRDGGLHLYFQAPPLPEGWRWRAHPNGADGRPLDGVDVRRPEGAYLIAPPSVHPATGSRYRWAADMPGTPAPIPTELLLACTARPALAGSRAAWDVPARRYRGPGEIPKAGGLARYVAQAMEGSRNQALFWAANRCLDDGLGEEGLRVVGEAAMSAGLSRSEVSKVIASALKSHGQGVAA